MENISNFLLIILASFILSNFYLFSWKFLLKQKMECNFKTLIEILFCTIALTFSNNIFPQPFRLIMTTLFLITINYFFVSRDLKKSLVLSVISQMIISLAEVMFVIVGSLVIGNQMDILVREPIVFIILHIYILIISCLVVKTKIVGKIYNLICNNKTKNFESIAYSLMIIVTMLIATIESHIVMPLTLVLTINTIMALIFISLVITSSKIKANYNRISSKYETSISSLREYEVMIDKFRVDTHENKNEFLTIRNMIKDNNDKDTVVKYIDKLVDNKIKDNDKIMKKTAKIPKGGLKATIYSKLCLMDKLKIKYNLNISREIRTTDLINLDEDLVLKICKILGVFLDNAIETVKELKKKEVSIEMYTIDNDLCIDITNIFKGKLEIEKLSDAKYTTKGEGHGYGLTLVNKILKEETERLENEKSINRDTFTQTLKIKM